MSLKDLLKSRKVFYVVISQIFERRREHTKLESFRKSKVSNLLGAESKSKFQTFVDEDKNFLTTVQRDARALKSKIYI